MSDSAILPEVIRPDWPAPEHVTAFATTRHGGVSEGPWSTLNLGARCGDRPEAVRENRARVARLAGAPITWLDQVHGTRVVDAAAAEGPADGVRASSPGRACAILSADCLPVLLCDRDGTEVAAVHAGWRGLAAGAIESALAGFDASPDSLLAWLGPAISKAHFEVGRDVLDAFVSVDAQAAAAFRPRGPGKWLADLYALAAQRLRARGVERIYGGSHCTFAEAERFFSYRRERTTGRLATVITLRPGRAPGR